MKDMDALVYFKKFFFKLKAIFVFIPHQSFQTELISIINYINLKG